MSLLNCRAAASAFAFATAVLGFSISPAVAQNYDAICVLVDSQGNALDLSRLCGDTSGSRRTSVKPVTARPRQLPMPQAGEVPDYGVIFLSPVGEAPIHLGDRSHYLDSQLGNASSGSVSNIRLHYDLLVSAGGDYISIGQGGKQIRERELGAGDRFNFKLSVADVMDDVIRPFQATEDIAIRITALVWTEADGSRNSFSSDSYRLAEGIGNCYFPWERDRAGRSCGTRAVSNRL